MTIRDIIVNGKPVRVQCFPNHDVVISGKKGGQRNAVLFPANTLVAGIKFNQVRGKAFPVEMLSLCAGRDKWMQEIEFKCKWCGARHAAKDMEGESCQKCLDEAGAENEKLDGN